MKPRYVAQVVSPQPYEPSFQVTAARSFKTAERARRWLQRKLPPVLCSRYTYHREIARAGWGDIYDRKRRRVIGSVEPEAIVLPSVGELGVTP
jgi:hypothetical protein